MRYAIYSRKSKYTGKGESIDNQKQLCMAYIEKNFFDDNNKQIDVFEDEGFSGKNTDRPEFQKMISEIKKKKYDYVVCYRLDRISRNVMDFAVMIEDLQRYKVSFVCIKEQFDTSNPMGKAMMYIASVFAQLERETIAERIRDNMMMLAKTGRWLGGTTPLGFKSIKEETTNADGKIKTSFKLSPEQDEIDIVELIFKLYLELESITAIETYLMNHDVKTRNGKHFVPLSIKEILSNPVYCTADMAVHEYFQKREAIIGSDASEFYGSYGIAPYNRTAHEGRYQSKQPVSEWIIAVGRHKGIIKSADWLKAQTLLERNRKYTFAYNPRNKTALLSGLLICSGCGSPMRPRVNSNSPLDKNGNHTFSYMCETKRISKRVKCDSKNLSGHKLDEEVHKQILSFEGIHPSMYHQIEELKSHIHKNGSTLTQSIRITEQQIADKEQDIDRLITLLSRDSGNSRLFAHTKEKINVLESQIARHKKDLAKMQGEQKTANNFDGRMTALIDDLSSFEHAFQTASVQDRRRFLQSIVEKMEWDGEEIHVFMLGGHDG